MSDFDGNAVPPEQESIMITKTRSRKKRESKKHALQLQEERRREAAQRAEEQIARRRFRISILWWVLIIGVVVGIVAFAWFSGERVRANAAAADAKFENTRVVMIDEPSQPLVQRVDGSYYSASDVNQDVIPTSFTTYQYTTLDDAGNIAQESVDSVFTRTWGWWIGERTEVYDVDISVQMISADATNQEPRVETNRCSVEPIDPSLPSYDGDPHVYTKPMEMPDKENVQLCADQITFYVPEGTVQPG